MKIQLLYGHGDVMSGYTHVNPFNTAPTDGDCCCDVDKLDDIVDDGEATEILAMDVIDYLSIPDVNNVIRHWVSKLAHGGRIIIGGTDLYEVCKAFANYSITITETNYLLHGEQTEPHFTKKVNFTSLGLSEYLTKELGLKLIKCRHNGFDMVVEAERE
jgi:hypothetical protein